MNSKPFICDTCQERFCKYKDLMVHKKEKHRNNGEEERCAKPGVKKVLNLDCYLRVKPLKFNSKLKIRLRKDKGEKPIKSEKEHEHFFDCDNDLKSETGIEMKSETGIEMKSEAEIETKSETGLETVKKRKCDPSSEYFKSNSSLKSRIKQQHTSDSEMPRFTDARPFHCTECTKTYKQKNSLKQHMRVHTNTKPYQCERCGKLFRSSGGWKYHMNKHKCQRTSANAGFGGTKEESHKMQSDHSSNGKISIDSMMNTKTIAQDSTSTSYLFTFPNSWEPREKFSNISFWSNSLL